MENLLSLTKFCPDCLSHKMLDSFHKNAQSRDGLVRYCKDCMNKRNREFCAKDDRVKKYSLSRRYGISIEKYNEMFEAQAGKCGICEKHQSELKRALCVDHCHVTGAVRGLLCIKCNAGIGQLNSGALLDKAKEYLKINDPDTNQTLTAVRIDEKDTALDQNSHHSENE